VKQQGNTTLGMVMLLLLLGSVTLHATRTQLALNMVLIADIQHYYQAFSQAQAALRWGTELSWSINNGWQCQQELTEQWQSCLLRRENDHGLLAARRTGNTLWLYRWVSLREQRVYEIPHGWIDFCPLTTAEACPAVHSAAGL